MFSSPARDAGFTAFAASGRPRGTVERSPKGWGIGLHRHTLDGHAEWMDDAPSIAVRVLHQDQVVTLPASARVLGGTSFTPCGILAYDDQPAISFRCHPEFDPAFARALVDRMRPGSADLALLDAAADALAQPNDCARVTSWIRAFVRGC